MRFNIDLRQTRAIKFEFSQIPLDPWESILLADCGEDVVTGDVNIRLPSGEQLAAAAAIRVGCYLFEDYPVSWPYSSVNSFGTR